MVGFNLPRKEVGGESRPFIAIFTRHSFCYLVNGVERLGGTISRRRYPGNLGSLIKIVTRNKIRSGYLLNIYQGAKWNHFPIPVADIEIAYLTWYIGVLRFGLEQHFEHPAES